MQNPAQEIISFTTIDHVSRKELGLTLEEYATADLIDKLAHNPKNTIPGWCHASKPKIAEILDIGRASVFRYIEKLLAEELIEKNPDQPNLLKTTAKWYECVVVRKIKLADKKKTKQDGPSQNETGSINSTLDQSQNETITPSQNETPQIYIDNDNNNSLVTNVTSDTALVEAKEYGDPQINALCDIFKKEYDHLPNVKKQRIAARNLIRSKTIGFEKAMNAARYAIEIQGQQFAPKICGPLDLFNKYGDLIVFYKKSQSKAPRLVKFNEAHVYGGES